MKLDNTFNQLLLQKAVEDKFNGAETIECKGEPRYPRSAEREYERVIKAYTRVIRDVIKQHIPAVMKLYKEQRTDGVHYDDDFNFTNGLNDEFNDIADEIEKKIKNFGIEKFLEKIGTMTKNTSLREWKRVVKNTLGIDILDDYYKGDFYAQQIRQWIDENVEMIKSIPADTLSGMKEAITESYFNGEKLRTAQKRIQDEYDVSKSKARSIVRDQIGTLTCLMAKTQQTDAGCKKYRWSTSKDIRVRDCHRELHGKIISWDDPPPMWYMTKSRGKVYTGRRCHPGEDYGCRCVAIPYFEIASLNIPMK